MKRMSFLPGLALYLRKRHLIYTVRSYSLPRAVVEIAGIGRCLRVPLVEVKCKGDLSPFVDQSGFSNVEDWWARVLSFVPLGEPKYLYRVEVMNE